MSTTATRELFVYDHPESKIRFLEQTLHGQDWRLRVGFAPNDPKSTEHIEAIRAACARKGYLVKTVSLRDGQAVLDIHHLGEGTKPSQVIAEMGAARGLAHLVTHPTLTFDALIEGAKGGGKTAFHVLRDPARANGFMYLVGEAFMMSSGFTKKGGVSRGKWSDPHNFLQSLAYSMFGLQSLTYLFVAKNNNDMAFEQYRKKLDETIKAGGTAEDVRFNTNKDTEQQTLWHRTKSFMQRYPIQMGALFNDIGMGIYIVRSMKLKKWYENILAKKTPASAELMANAKKYTTVTKRFGIPMSTFRFDILGAVISIVAWAVLLIKPKTYSIEQQEADADHPLRRFWHKFRADPQVAAGLMTVASSGSRLKSAISEKDRMQAIGETIYLGGDFALLFTKNDNYGSKNSKDVRLLAERVGDYVAGLPFVYGHEAQEKMIHAMADFLRAKSLREIKDNPHATQFTLPELDERREILMREVKMRVRNQQDEFIERIADVANRLSLSPPMGQSGQGLEAMAKAFADLPWMHITPTEMREAIEASRQRKPEIKAPKTNEDIREAISELTEIIPGIDKGQTVASLYEAITHAHATVRPSSNASAKPATMPAAPPATSTPASIAPGAKPTASATPLPSSKASAAPSNRVSDIAREVTPTLELARQ